MFKASYANTALLYDLQSNQLKESVIIKAAKDTLTGYKYVLSAPNMVLELQNGNSIHVYAADAAESDETLLHTISVPTGREQRPQGWYYHQPIA